MFDKWPDASLHLLLLKSSMVKQLLDDTEQVDVSVVDREVQGHESGAAANPESLHKLPEDPPGFVPSRAKILDRSSSTVG